MKTKLLLLFALLNSALSFSQFNINEGFESGTIPAGWTTDFIDGVETHSSSCGGTKSARANFYSTAYATIYTSSYVSNGSAINVSFYTRKNIGAFFGYNYLYYEVNGTGTWTQIASVYSDFSTCTPISATIAAGVVPNGATVKFRMQVNRASATDNNYVFFDNFSASQTTTTPTTIAEYNFDNTFSNTNGNSSFISTISENSFVEDRNGNPNSAIYVLNSMVANINGLPISNNTRSVSLWIKPITISTIDNGVFRYGNTTTNAAYGFSFKPTTINNYGWANDLVGSVSLPNNTWKHVVCTYNSTGFASVYIDGVFVLSGHKPTWNTISNGDFLINGFNGYIDDLKIYNYALNATEVSSLYTNNTLSTSDFSQDNLEVALYPNPVRDILNIEIENDIQSIEIYNIQGQKVLSSNQKQINVSDLASGMYMVRIQDTENNIATKKIVIK